jgi:hypothetical protein
MVATITLGDNYTIEENSNGDLEIVDADGSTVARHDDSSDEWSFFDPTAMLELTVTSDFTDPAGVSHTGELADASDAVSDHGDLSGLGDDDHTQYLLTDGTRSATGDIDAPRFTVGGNPIASAVVASGSVQLSSGSATVDTGIATTNTATFTVGLGPATDDADVGADIRADSGSGNYEVDIQETDTDVGNPTVEYDIVRVR